MATNAEQLEKEMQTLRAEVERLRTDLGSVAAEKVRKTVERAGAEAERARTTVAKEVEERPLTSIGIAFVIGLLLGVLFGRWR